MADALARDITDFNLLKDDENDTPGYVFNPRNKCFTYIFDETGDVYLQGEYDNNYIYWLSKTPIDHISINNEIINQITNGKPSKIVSRLDSHNKLMGSPSPRGVKYMR